MTIYRINSPEIQDPLTKVLDYLEVKERRVFNAISRTFKSAFFLHSLNRYFTPDLCREPASSPRLLGAHRQIAHSSHRNRFLPICSKTLTPKDGCSFWDFPVGWFGPREISFTPDGKNFFMESLRGLEMWDVESDRCIRTYADACEPNNITLTRNGKTLIATTYLIGARRRDTTIKIWDVESGTCTHTLTGHTDAVTALVLTPDGNTLISASADNTIKLWDIKTDTCTHTLTGHTGAVTALVLTPDGKNFISISKEEGIRVERGYFNKMNIWFWDIESGRCLLTPNQIPQIRYFKWPTIIEFTPDGKNLIWNDDEKLIKIWNIESGRYHILQCENQEEKQWWHEDEDEETMINIAFTQDGKHIIPEYKPGRMKVWNIESGRCLDSPENAEFIPLPPNKKSLISTSDRFLRPLDLENPEETSTPITITPDRKRLISASSSSGGITTWNIKTWNMYPLLEDRIPKKTSTKTIAQVTLLDIGQYLEAIAERNDGQYEEFILAAVPFTIERINTLPDAIKKEIYAQLQNPLCRSLCIEGDENVSDPRSIKHSVEKFFSRINQLPQYIQDAFYEELHKLAPPDSQYLTTRNALRVASAALGMAAAGTALVGFLRKRK